MFGRGYIDIFSRRKAGIERVYKYVKWRNE